MDKSKFTQLCELHNSIIRKQREIEQYKANDERYGVDEYAFERRTRICKRMAVGCKW